MSQSCFFLGFLSQYSLWKLSIFCGYKGYLYCCENGMRRVRFFQNKAGWRLDLATWLSSEFKPWANRIAKLDFLSCSALTGVTVHLVCMLHSCASSGGLPVASQLRVPVASPYYFAQTWAFLHTLSHTTLTWFPPKYRVTNCKLQANLARNKVNKMVD